MQLDALKIRKKIISIGKIQKITNSLKIIASMKIKKLTIKVDKSTKNFIELLEFFKILIAENQKKNPQPTKTIWILLNSDLGLCGAYNSQIFNLFNSNKKFGDKIIAIGRKGIIYLQSHNESLIWSSVAETFNWLKIGELAEYLTKELNDEMKFVKIIAPTIKTNSSSNFEIINLLPFDQPLVEPKPNNSFIHQELLVEPNFQSVYEHSLPIYLHYAIFKFSFLSRLIEEQMRAMAMDSASENAEEIAEELKLKYNQSRQQKITQEIITVTQV